MACYRAWDLTPNHPNPDWSIDGRGIHIHASIVGSVSSRILTSCISASQVWKCAVKHFYNCLGLAETAWYGPSTPSEVKTCGLLDLWLVRTFFCFSQLHFIWSNHFPSYRFDAYRIVKPPLGKCQPNANLLIVIFQILGLFHLSQLGVRTCLPHSPRYRIGAGIPFQNVLGDCWNLATWAPWRIFHANICKPRHNVQRDLPQQPRMHFNPKDGLASTEEGRRKLVQALMNNSLGASMGIGAVDPAELPRRYLPPGMLGMLLVVCFCSTCLPPIQLFWFYFQPVTVPLHWVKVMFQLDSMVF